MTFVIPGSRSRTGRQRASSAAPSSTAIRASQSAATYPICSGASVAYNVTPRPPACTAPRSARTCSLRFGSINATLSPGASPSTANPAATSSTRCLACCQIRDREPAPATAPVSASSEYALASPAVAATSRNSSHKVRPAITPSISARRRTMSLLTVSSTLGRQAPASPGRIVTAAVGGTSPHQRMDHQTRPSEDAAAGLSPRSRPLQREGKRTIPGSSRRISLRPANHSTSPRPIRVKDCPYASGGGRAGWQGGADGALVRVAFATRRPDTKSPGSRC